MNALLRSLNTHLVGYIGVSVGGFSILGAIAALFKLLSDPSFLVALYGAVIRAGSHSSTPADVQTFAQLIGAGMAIFGGIILALFASYFGMPTTIPPDSPNTH